MGKTTVFVDEVLIRDALRVTNLKTKKEVIEAGLQELVRKKNQELLQQELRILRSGSVVKGVEKTEGRTLR